MYSYNGILIISHITFWLLNYWFIAFAVDINWMDFTSASNSLAVAYAYGLFFNAFLFYFQVFWLFPKLYIQYKRQWFYGSSISTILLISLLETYFDHVLYNTFQIQTRESFMSCFTTNTIFHVLYSAAGFYYILKFEYRKSEQVKQELLEETYKTELKYLKAQLNPHFLFNGINSIYLLIGKNNVQAKETLLQFSGLLRYQLYESSANITLEKELDYVTKYIQIEETRKGEYIKVQYNVMFDNPTINIAPLLLIPFIENAFKHCSNYIDNHKNIIDIAIKEFGGKLELKVINSFDHFTSKHLVGGIGLENVKRRLSLLYPDNHQLDISSVQNTFKVHLIIQL